MHLLQKQTIRKVATSDFARNSAKLLSANVVAQAIGLLVYPFLTRLYSPADFGLLNLFLSIGGVAVLFATAEYQAAIVLPASERKAAACLHTGFFIALGVSLLCLLSVAFSTPISALFKTPSLAEWYWLLPFFVLITACWNLLNAWYVRHKCFGYVGTYQVTQGVTSAAAKCGLGTIGFTSGGLIVSIVLAPLLALLGSIVGARKGTLKLLLKVHLPLCRAVASEYANFPKYSLPRVLVGQISGQLPVLLLMPVFGAKYIGFWGMAVLLGFAPISMITQSLHQILYQKTAETVLRKQSIAPMFRLFIRVSSVVLLPTFALLLPFLPMLTQWLLGPEWFEVGQYIRYLLPWLFVSALTASISFISDVFLLQKKAFAFDVLVAILRAAGVLCGILTHNFTVAVIGYSVGSSVGIFAQLVWLLGLVRKYERSLTA